MHACRQILPCLLATLKPRAYLSPPMSSLVLPASMFAASLLGSALVLARLARRGDAQDAKASAWMDGLYPIAAAFFIGF
jgi:hypothetical protein